jgi:Arc/MetJ-type ribon-helix-helix transcriptional regulator
MLISLKPELEHYIQEQVKQGRFASEADLIEAAIAQLMLDHSDDDFDDERIAAINRSLEQVAQGRVRPFEHAAAQLRKKHLGR